MSDKDGVSRLGAALARARRDGALSVYLPAGYPDHDASLACCRAALTGGADWLEVGIPFSDPAADGPVIQAATAQALRQGYRVHQALDLVAKLRREHPQPVVAMTYANIAHSHGWDTFARRLAAAGVDGLILPDVPLEESGPVRAALSGHGVAWVPLVTPTTPADRMERIAATCTGFLYVVGNVGITGQADPGPLVEATVQRARSVTDAPIAVGFGIASADDVARVRRAGADAAIVGSHIVRLMERGPKVVEDEVRRLRHGLLLRSDAET